MYRYPTKHTDSRHIMCTNPDCQTKGMSEVFVSQFRIDYVKAGVKQVITGNDIELQEVCRPCFMVLVERQFQRLSTNEKLN